MSKTAMPVATDLTSFLAGANLMDTVPSGDVAELDYAGAVIAGLAAWEDATGFVPFEAAAADVTRYYTPHHTNVLDLAGGVTAALTSLTVGCSTTSTGTALTVNQDYWLRPLNAIATSRPATWIEFAARQSGLPRSIVVVGKFGWCVAATIPDDAWRAVLLASALTLTPQLDALQSRGMLKKLTEGDVTYEYNLAGLREAWSKSLAATTARYRRLSVT